MESNTAAPAVRRLPDQTQKELDATKFYPDFRYILKELLENSIDAGANFVTATLDIPNLSLIVTDDGHGISWQGIQLLCTTRASSRIQKSDENANSRHSCFQQSPSTHQKKRFRGFLGQALQALASVSSVTIVTRVQGSDSVVEKVVTFGEVVSCRPIPNISHNVGTTIRVSRLFEKQPVRRKLFVRHQC